MQAHVLLATVHKVVCRFEALVGVGDLGGGWDAEGLRFLSLRVCSVCIR